MKKILLFIVLSGSMPSLIAQSQGHVGINTPTPTATLHVKANGSAAATQTLKLENSAGVNLLTINDDGTVSGAAAMNLMSGTATAPKGSGMFSGMATTGSDGHLSPVGNGYVGYSTNSFYDVAPTVAYTTALDLLTFTVRTTTVNNLNSFFSVELYVNNAPTGYIAFLSIPANAPVGNYTSFPISGSVILQRGNLFTYRIINYSNFSTVKSSVSVRYTEQ